MPETYTNATSWYKVFTIARDSDTKYSLQACHAHHLLDPRRRGAAPLCIGHGRAARWRGRASPFLGRFAVEGASVAVDLERLRFDAGWRGTNEETRPDDSDGCGTSDPFDESSVRMAIRFRSRVV